MSRKLLILLLCNYNKFQPGQYFCILKGYLLLILGYQICCANLIVCRPVLLLFVWKLLLADYIAYGSGSIALFYHTLPSHSSIALF